MTDADLFARSILVDGATQAFSRANTALPIRSMALYLRLVEGSTGVKAISQPAWWIKLSLVLSSQQETSSDVANAGKHLVAFLQPQL